MNVSRLTAIAFSLILLSACGGGGGGGGGGSAGAGIGGGAGGGGGVPSGTEDLPVSLVNAADARTFFNETVPLNMTQEQIEANLQSRASGATPIFNDIFNLSTSTGTADPVKCMDDGACTAEITSGDDMSSIQFSLGDFSDVPQFRGVSLTRYNRQYEAVMSHRGVDLVQVRGAALSPDDTAGFQFQSYGGWLENSVFAVQTLKGGSREDESESILLTSYSFGNVSETNPSRSGELRWGGVVVGINKETDNVIQGVVEVEYNTITAGILDRVVFDKVKNLSDGANVTFGDDESTSFSFENINLTDGSFASTDPTNGDIKGAFYGDNHEEVGGILDGHDIVGAFGAASTQ